jgi:uncharacterized protein (TIGR02001 family)
MATLPPSRPAWWPLVTLAVAVGYAPAVLAQGRSPNLEGYVTLANDYRSLGLSQLDSGASWQVGIDYEHASGFFVGAFAANVEYAVEATRPEQRGYVVDYYAGYAWGARGWRFNVALGRYVYPDISFDYDYSELTFSTTFRNRFSYTTGYTNRLYSRPYSAWHHEVVLAQPLRWDIEVSAAIGYFTHDVPTYENYTYWNVGLSKVLRHVGLDLRFYEATLEEASFLGDPKGESWVLSASYRFPFGD